MLKETMGSPDAFEFRREELTREKRKLQNIDNVDSDDSSVLVSDEEVVQSYMNTCCPGKGGSCTNDIASNGLMTQYLHYASLACKVGSVLFIHGALPVPPSIDYPMNKFDYAMPWLSQSNEGASLKTMNNLVSTPQEWIDALNRFATEQVASWTNISAQDVREGTLWCTKGGYNNAGSIAGGPLLQYGMGSLPDNTKNPTVVYNSWLNDGLPQFDDDTMNYEATVQLLRCCPDPSYCDRA